jgi:rhodanese-related sulfurtransferase
MKSNKILIAVMALVGLILLGQLLMPADGIDVKQAHALSQQGALLLDVREPQEYAAVHVQNAKLIPLGDLGSRMNELEAYKDKPIVVMCRSGRRSASAVAELKDAGYTRVSNVRGGITAWEKEGLEVIKK